MHNFSVMAKARIDLKALGFGHVEKFISQNPQQDHFPDTLRFSFNIRRTTNLESGFVSSKVRAHSGQYRTCNILFILKTFILSEEICLSVLQFCIWP